VLRTHMRKLGPMQPLCWEGHAVPWCLFLSGVGVVLGSLFMPFGPSELASATPRPDTSGLNRDGVGIESFAMIPLRPHSVVLL